MEKKILINGKIWTEETRKPWAEAVAIDGKIFAAVGTNDEVIRYAKFNFGEYETVDLGGRTVLPGLIDGHTHPSMIAKATWVIFGPDTFDREELCRNIREAAEQYPKEVKPYFVYSSYHASTFGEDGPRKEMLDELIRQDDAVHGKRQDGNAHVDKWKSRHKQMDDERKGQRDQGDQGGDKQFFCKSAHRELSPVQKG